jgi:tetratricopeptide (TPR) repeat protein
MAQIVVELKHIVVDPDNPVDLEQLPIEEAIQRIKEVYRDFAPDAEVTIENGTAIITLPDADSRSQSQAQDYFSRGVRAAQRGKYDAAIDLFKKTLEIVPDQPETHRNLAMAYMESGNSRAAKRHLVRTMQLEPDDAWAHTIMGNLYLQYENDLGSAERYYQSAYDLNPDDLYLLNSYGVLKGKRNQYAEAQEFFLKALAIDPHFPNARHGLALLHQRQGELLEAISQLEALFSAPSSIDQRSQPVYEQARLLFLHTNQQLAEVQQEQAMGKLRDDIDAYSRNSRYPIHLEEDSTITFSAAAQIAWVHGRQEHRIKYKATKPGILPHMIAHEFEHIRMIDAAVRVGRNRLFSSTQETEAYARRSIANDIRRIQRTIKDERAASDYVSFLLRGLPDQLFNQTLDMFIEYRLYHRYPYLNPSQVASLHEMVQEGIRGLEPSLRQMAPNRIWQASMALNSAFAHFTDHLLGGATNYAEAYRSSGQYQTGARLFQLWQQKIDSYQPGDEYDLVDDFARELKLERWYQWQEDVTVDRDLAPRDAGLEKTKAELLQEREPASVMYCLAALQEFEDMDRQHILAIVSEIALLGRSGLSYTSSEQKYTLSSLPGNFTGLQLMCFMYVGFQMIDPTLDTGVDFSSAYKDAQSLHSKRSTGV